VSGDDLPVKVEIEALELEALELGTLELEALELGTLELEALELEALELEALELEALELESLELESLELESLELESLELESLELGTLELESLELETSESSSIVTPIAIRPFLFKVSSSLIAGIIFRKIWSRKKLTGFFSMPPVKRLLRELTGARIQISILFFLYTIYRASFARGLPRRRVDLFFRFVDPRFFVCFIDINIYLYN